MSGPEIVMNPIRKKNESYECIWETLKFLAILISFLLHNKLFLKFNDLHFTLEVKFGPWLVFIYPTAKNGFIFLK